jgi:hypothetical protein
VQERAGQGEALPHAARKGAHKIAAAGGESGDREKMVHFFLGTGEAVEPREELQVFLRGEVVVKQRRMGHEADVAPQLKGKFCGARTIGVGERDRASRRPGEASGDAQQSALAGTVGTEQGNKFARCNFEGDTAKRSNGTVTLFDLLEADAEAGAISRPGGNVLYVVQRICMDGDI